MSNVKVQNPNRPLQKSIPNAKNKTNAEEKTEFI
jgi:hypothetical protein